MGTTSPVSLSTAGQLTRRVNLTAMRTSSLCVRARPRELRQGPGEGQRAPAPRTPAPAPAPATVADLRQRRGGRHDRRSSRCKRGRASTRSCRRRRATSARGRSVYVQGAEADRCSSTRLRAIPTSCRRCSPAMTASPSFGLFDPVELRQARQAGAAARTTSPRSGSSSSEGGRRPERVKATPPTPTRRSSRSRSRRPKGDERARRQQAARGPAREPMPGDEGAEGLDARERCSRPPASITYEKLLLTDAAGLNLTLEKQDLDPDDLDPVHQAQPPGHAAREDLQEAEGQLAGLRRPARPRARRDPQVRSPRGAAHVAQPAIGRIDRGGRRLGWQHRGRPIRSGFGSGHHARASNRLPGTSAC